uniref:Uncharacterized protein n=1 Tax=Arundo donax TaxID=35708 RepID=A0A0A9H9R7_ARUDO
MIEPMLRSCGWRQGREWYMFLNICVHMFMQYISSDFLAFSVSREIQFT